MKILVGISGGVDSAAAAKMLMDAGHTVAGATLVMHEFTELDSARRVAASLGIPLHEIDCRADFDRHVRTNLVTEYTSGRTPNPCIVCNALVKFRRLADLATELGFDAIATGHYARIRSLAGRPTVAVAADPKKDQSYMLYRLSPDILSMLVLPLSELSKPEIRAYAASVGIPVADKADSLEICFLPDGNHAAYIESVAGKCPEGDFVDENGNILGRHLGITRYTVGQRKGLGVALGSRAFITDINPETNRITLSTSPKKSSVIRISSPVFSGIPELSVGDNTDAFVKVRYAAPAVAAHAICLPDGRIELHFDSEVTAAPGQSAVAYDASGSLLFGGFIDRI